MKKIIDGKRYDTDTAKELGYDSHGNGGDFSYWCETLYQKRTGEFFLRGEGGAMSRYAEPQGQNTWSGGSRIIPLSVENAKAWAEEHLSADSYERIFGEVEEDGSRKICTYSLPLSTIEKIKRLSLERGVSMSDIVAEAVNNF